MFKSILLLVLTCLVAFHTASGQVIKRHFENPKEDVLTFSISLSTVSARRGTPIVLEALLHNKSKRLVSFDYEMSREPEYEYDIDIVDGSGTHPPLTPKGEYFFSGKYSQAGKYDVVKLHPGEDFIQKVDLLQLFTLGPGVYNVTLRHGSVVSNTAAFTVVESQP